MTALILDGKAIAAEWLASALPNLQQGLKAPPQLAIMRVGDNPASAIYVKRKIAAAAQHKLGAREIHLPATVSQSALASQIEALNADKNVQGILLQLPLPPALDPLPLMALIDPLKDVDGLSPLNAGRLWQVQANLCPCTPAGIMHLLSTLPVQLGGMQALVIGRSNIVGRPVSALLEQAGVTVTLAHSRTKNLPGLCKDADIVIAAMGQPHYVQGEWLKAGAIAIDVGISRRADKIYGDFEPISTAARASYLTPVPGGVGPLTVAALLVNLCLAARQQIATTVL